MSAREWNTPPRRIHPRDMDKTITAAGLCIALGAAAVAFLHGKAGPLYSAGIIIGAALIFVGIFARMLHRFYIKHHGFMVAGVLGIALCIGIYNLGVRSLWYDEVTSILHLQAVENRFLIGPPEFYYLIMDAVTLFGRSEFIVRLPSVLFGVVMAAATYLLGRMLFGKTTGLLGALFVATSPWNLAYMQTARMYTLLGLLSTASTLLLLRALQSNRNAEWTAYALTTLANLNVHFSAYGVLLGHALFAAYTRMKYPTSIKKFLISGVCMTAFTLAILPFIQQWYAAVTTRVPAATAGRYLVQTAFSLSTGFDKDSGFYAPVFLCILLAIGLREARRANKDGTVLLLLGIAAPVAMLEAFPMLRYTRYLFMLLPLCAILVARGIASWTPRTAVIITLSIFMLNAYLLSDVYVKETDDWRGAAEFIKNAGSVFATVVPSHERVCLEYYGVTSSGLPGGGKIPNGFVVLSENAGGENVTPGFTDACTKRAEYTGLYIFSCNASDIGF
jgi:4-amino-4-deoxy-L-arabinose transferase-like glycosyltransferase